MIHALPLVWLYSIIGDWIDHLYWGRYHLWGEGTVEVHLWLGSWETCLRCIIKQSKWTRTWKENNSTIPCALTATPAVILPTRAARSLKVHLTEREIHAALVVFPHLLASRENATVDNISCYSPIHDHFDFQRKPQKQIDCPVRKCKVKYIVKEEYAS